MFSIYNRILGIILFFVVLIFLCMYFNIFKCTIKNIYLVSYYNTFLYSDNILIKFINLISLVFIIVIISYHVVYSSFKIYTKSSKIFQIISSKIYILNDLYLDILKLVLLLAFYFIKIIILNKKC